MIGGGGGSGVVIHPNVLWNGDGTLGEFVVIGVQVSDSQSTKESTTVGPTFKIRSHTVIYAGSTIGAEFQTGHGVLIREACRIGNRVSVGSHSIIEHHVQIGDRVRIHSNAFIPEFSILEDDVWVGPGVVLTNAKYPASPGAKKSLKGPLLKKGARIGAAATILPGVVVGANSLVGAGSVVVRDVPDDAVVAGNPARVLRSVKDIAAYRSAGNSSSPEMQP